MKSERFEGGEEQENPEKRVVELAEGGEDDRKAENRESRGIRALISVSVPSRGTRTEGPTGTGLGGRRALTREILIPC